MKSSDLIIKLLVENHVNRAWYVQGGAVSHLIDSAYLREQNSNDFKSTFVQHEQAAGFAADAYSRCGDSIGSVMVTSGPGATNVMTAIASSWYDGVPVVYLCGQVRTWEASINNQRQKGFQETDIVSMAKTVTKYAKKVTDIRFLKYEIQKAIFYAKKGRPGPVLLDLPMDMQWTDINENTLIEFKPPITPYESINQHKIDKISEIHRLLLEAERPVMLVGGGISSKETCVKIKTYCDQYCIPLVTSFAGKQLFPNDWQNNFGFIGTMGMHSANNTLHNSDVLLVIGSRLSWRQIRSNPDAFAKYTKIIHVDLDQSELNGNVESFITLHCDGDTFFDLIAKNTQIKESDSGVNIDIRSEYINECNILKNTYQYLPKNFTQQDKLHPHLVMAELNSVAAPDGIFCLDTGQNLIWAIQGIISNGERQMISSWGHSPMGYSICAALGASELPCSNQVICIIGDGGIQMNIQELQTIALNNYNIKIIVINNKSLGAIKEFQDDNLGGRHVGTGSSIDYKSPDIAKISDAYGIKSASVTTLNSLKTKLTEFFSFSGPALLNVDVDESTKMVLSLEKYH